MGEKSTTDYKAVLCEAMREPAPDHIEPNPRWGLAGAYVFTRDVGTDELRYMVEQQMGVRPRIDPNSAVHCVTYVLPAEFVPSKQTKQAIDERGLNGTHTVFVRGALNSTTHRFAYDAASQMINDALGEIYQAGVVLWPEFMDPEIRKQELAQARILGAYDKELRQMEGAECNPFGFKFNRLTGRPFGL